MTEDTDISDDGPAYAQLARQVFAAHAANWAMSRPPHPYPEHTASHTDPPERHGNGNAGTSSRID